MFELQIADPSLKVLGQLLATATQYASVAMGRWTNGQVTLTLDEVQEVALEEVASSLDIGDELMTMVVLGIDGDPGGQLILAFDSDNGRALAASLLQREISEEAEWSPLEESALMETGNILASAYLCELTRLCTQDLAPTAPTFIQDFGASVLEQALMVQAMVADRVLVCKTRFEFNKNHMNWSVFFVPSQELINTMNEALHSN